MATNVKKESRIEFRVQAATKEVLEQAASLRGQSLSAYALSTLVENARQVIERANRLEVTARDHRHFLLTLDRQESPNRALAEAARDYHDYQDALEQARRPNPDE